MTIKQKGRNRGATVKSRLKTENPASTTGRKKAARKEQKRPTEREELLRLKSELNETRNLLSQEFSRCALLATRLASMESGYARFSKFQVTVQQLLMQQTHEDLFVTIREIIGNLVGSEEIGIFRLDDNKRNLTLISSMGLDPESIGSVPIGNSLIGGALLRSEVYWGGEATLRSPQELGITACIPIRVNHYLYGVIAIFHLLPQKVALESADRELLLVLGKLTAALLLCTSDPYPIAAMKENVDVVV